MKKCGILTRFTVVQAIMVTLFTASGPGRLAQPRLACARASRRHHMRLECAGGLASPAHPWCHSRKR